MSDVKCRKFRSCGCNFVVLLEIVAVGSEAKFAAGRHYAMPSKRYLPAPFLSL